MRSDSDCPFTWTPHTSTPCTARGYPAHGSPISPFTDPLADNLTQELEDKWPSKVRTLQVAIYYIKHLQRLLVLNASGMEVSLGDARNCPAAAENRVQQWWRVLAQVGTVLTNRPSEFSGVWSPSLPLVLSLWHIRNARAGPEHRQYKQILGALSSAGGAENRGK